MFVNLQYPTLGDPIEGVYCSEEKIIEVRMEMLSRWQL